MSTGKQSLIVTANGAAPVVLLLLFTVGMWDTTEVVGITLQHCGMIVRL
jgi:hypothetical protein